MIVDGARDRRASSFTISARSRTVEGRFAFCARRMVMDTQRFAEHLQTSLQGLSYVQREVFKLRTGLGDGYSYRLDEIAVIFKQTPLDTASHYRETVAALCASLTSKLESGDALRADGVKLLLPGLCEVVPAHTEEEQPSTEVIATLCNEYFSAANYDVRYVGWERLQKTEILSLCRAGAETRGSTFLIRLDRAESGCSAALAGRMFAVRARTNRTDMTDSFFAFCQPDGDTEDIEFLDVVASKHSLEPWLKSREIDLDPVHFTWTGPKQA